ncbi:MAG: sigma-70 family RNA polymerase sigma factor [Anaerolineales bacterium]
MSERENTQEPFSIQALREGDRTEFARVVEAYSEKMYRLILKMLRNPQDAEDILQETFLKAYRGFEDFRGNAKISTWLYRIATNEALMFLRQKEEPKVSIDKQALADDGQAYNPMKIVDWCCLPEQELLSSEAMDYLDRAVDQLSESMRITFLLRDLEGLSTQETAEVLSISEAAVKTRLSRARMHLRERLSGYYGRKLDASPIDTPHHGGNTLEGSRS